MAADVSYSENQLHRTVAEFLDWALFDGTVYTTFPAGWSKLGKAVAGSLKGCGLKAGIPDLLLFHAGRTVGLELKVPGKKPSAQQQMMFARLRRAGVSIHVCSNLTQCIDAIRQENIPLRGRLGWDSHKEDDDGTKEISSGPLAASNG